MKITITIENGSTKIEVDDEQPIVLSAGPDDPNAYIVAPDGQTARPVPPVLNDPKEWDVMPENRDPIVLPPRTTVTPTPPPAKKSKKKVCEICGDTFVGHKLAKVCSPKCRKEKQRRYAANYNVKKHTMKIDENAYWCKKCEAFTTHDTKGHKDEPFTLDEPKIVDGPNTGPLFLPGHEKSAEEISSWEPKPILPGQPEYASATHNDSEAGRKPKK